MILTPRQLTKAMIKQNQKAVFTKPENIVQQIAEELGKELDFIAEQNIPLRLYETPADGMVGNLWTYQIDHFLHSPNFKKQICLHTDGKYHDTKRIEQKDRWKDGVIILNNMRSFHVDAGLTETEEWRDYLKDRLRKAIKSDKDIVYLNA